MSAYPSFVSSPFSTMARPATTGSVTEGWTFPSSTPGHSIFDHSGIGTDSTAPDQVRLLPLCRPSVSHLFIGIPRIVLILVCMKHMSGVRLCIQPHTCDRLYVSLQTEYVLHVLYVIHPQAFRVGKAGHLFLDRKQNLPGPEGIVSPANCDLLDGVQRIVDDLWAEFGEEIAGKRGKRACQIQAARDSHPEFPIFSAILSSMPSLGNGPLRHWMCIVQLSVQFIHALTSFVSCVYIANVHRV